MNDPMGPSLFDDEPAEIEAEIDRPNCPRCGRPVVWRRSRKEWGSFCGSNHCDSPTRICVQCGKTFRRAEGLVKFCSVDCRELLHHGHLVNHGSRSRPACVVCGKIAAEPTTGGPGGYMCDGCALPLRFVKGALMAHRVEKALWLRLIADPTCPLCGIDLVTPAIGRGGKYRARLAVDHDHGCCPGVRSCGKCVRGLVCHECNSMLGLARDNAESLRRAADYLEEWAVRYAEADSRNL